MSIPQQLPYIQQQPVAIVGTQDSKTEKKKLSGSIQRHSSL